MNYCALALAVALTATMRVAPPSLADAARGAGENVRLQLLECDDARTMGREVAPRVENQWKWRLLGFILPGAGSLHALAVRAEPQNTIALENMTDEAVACYVDGYQSAARESRSWWATEGGVVAIVLVFFALGAES